MRHPFKSWLIWAGFRSVELDWPFSQLLTFVTVWAAEWPPAVCGSWPV